MHGHDTSNLSPTIDAISVVRNAGIGGRAAHHSQEMGVESGWVPPLAVITAESGAPTPERRVGFHGTCWILHDFDALTLL